MAVFRNKSNIPFLTGDVAKDISLLRDALYDMEEELRYVLSQIDGSNINEAYREKIENKG